MRHPGAGLVIAVLAAGCGDNLQPDPFLELVQVSGDTPFAPQCGGEAESGGVFAGVEVEPSVAADPTRPSHLVGAWQQDRWGNGGAHGVGTAASFDGGATWTLGIPHFGRCSPGNPEGAADYERATDPWLTFAADGTVYVGALVFDSTSARNAMAVSRSADGGVTWGEPALLITDNDADVFNDKDTITADPTDAGRVYAVWDRLTGLTHPKDPTGTGPTYFARMTDGVWEPARAIIDPGANAQTIGNVIAVLPDGTLVDVFNLITSANSDAPGNMVAVARSSDHGLTWSAPQTIAAMRGVGVRDPSNGDFIRSGTDLPEVAVDRASGALYIVWEDVQPGTAIDGVVLIRSLDGGVTWSAPSPVNRVPTAAAFTPVVAVASDGTVGVTYYDLRNAERDPHNFRSSAWLATSHDGGITWSEEALGGAFDLAPATLANIYFLGDYEGLATSGAMFLPFFVGTTFDASDRTDVFVRALK
ncbi:MAG TPA: sialidase family protein [Kofleriaceae bacterium]|jgi:hypothetical protein|nr:sialidase family protein [Kofleriaceae bacterium]